METWALGLLLMSLHGAAAVRHSLKYFYTGSSGLTSFPEFVTVGLVDEVEISHYDSNTRRAEPKQGWMSSVTEEDPEYWKTNTEIFMGEQQVFKGAIEILKQRFNKTGGVHIYQRMYGCEWDDETNEVNGYEQLAFDGEDFIAFDLKTETYIAPKPQALITKHKWDHNKAWIAQNTHYYTQYCPEWLRKYLQYGSSSLTRTELPSVSLLQKTPSSPVCCHATGFYPNRAALFWRKDGEELHEDVEHGEILPNHDGTFQMSVDLKPPSVPAEDRGRYECVFQLSGVESDVVTRLNESEIRTNREKPFDTTTTSTTTTTTIIIIAAVAAPAILLLLVGLAVVGFKACKKGNGKAPPANVMTPLNPPAPSDSASDSSSAEGVNSATHLMS